MKNKDILSIVTNILFIVGLLLVLITTIPKDDKNYIRELQREMLTIKRLDSLKIEVNKDSQLDKLYYYIDNTKGIYRYQQGNKFIIEHKNMTIKESYDINKKLSK